MIERIQSETFPKFVLENTKIETVLPTLHSLTGREAS